MTAGQGDGAIRRRTDRDSLSGQGAAVSEDREPKPVVPIRVGQNRAGNRGGSRRPASRGRDRGSGDDAGHCFRFALNAGPSGPEDYASAAARIVGRNWLRKEKRGILNEATKANLYRKLIFQTKRS